MDQLFAFAAIATGVLVAFLLRRAGIPRTRANLVGVGAVVVLAATGFAYLIVHFGECLAENPDPPPPPAWPWSPRREFCNEPGSAAALGGYALLVAPFVATLVGALLWRRARLAGALAWVVAALVPFSFGPYVAALPYYRVEDTPILQDPLLRPGSAERPPRVCYVYAISSSTALSRHDDERVCVELEPTREAMTLTPAYDEGRTVYDLEWMGKELTEKGLPIEPGPTGIHGLTVARVYRLSDAQARQAAHDID